MDVIAGFIDELEQAGRAERPVGVLAATQRGVGMSGSNIFGEFRRMRADLGSRRRDCRPGGGGTHVRHQDRPRRHAEDLRTILGGLKGPLMKVAQFLSTVPDALPAEYAAELAQLQSNAPAMGWNFVRRRMASELGPDWQ